MDVAQDTARPVLCPSYVRGFVVGAVDAPSQRWSLTVCLVVSFFDTPPFDCSLAWTRTA